MSFLYKDYHIPGPQMQIYTAVAALPWALKPIIGVLSDLCPIGGYHKAPYIVITSVIGIMALGLIGVVPHDALPATGLCALFFCCALQRSVADLLCEAKYAERIAVNPSAGPDLITFVWGGLEMWGFLALLCVGPIIANLGPKAPYLIVVPMAAFILLPVGFNYLEESPQTEEAIAARRKKLMEQKECFGLCILMFVGTVIMTASGLLVQDATFHFVVAMVILVVMLVTFSVTLRPIVAKVNAFFLLQTSLGAGVGGASFYFFTDSKENYPEGPHFSVEFYTTVLGTVSSVCSIIGMVFYNRYMKKWKYRTLLIFTNILMSILGLLDVALFSRLNVKYGVSDVYFVLGSTVTSSVIFNWMWMPGVLINTHLVPKGMEATMYALLAGCHNLGGSISSYLGAYCLAMWNVEPAGKPNETHQFDNLWKASLVGTVLPAFTILLIPLLIPDATQTDKLIADDDNPESATKGSLLEQWRGHTPSVSTSDEEDITIATDETETTALNARRVGTSDLRKLY